MTDIPAVCQAVADEVARLKSEYNDVATQTNSTTGTAVWPLLARLAELQEQISTAEQDLQSCLATVPSNPTGTWDSTSTDSVSGPAVTGQVVLIDATATLMFGPLTATAWEWADLGIVEFDRCDVSDGTIAFARALPPAHAVSISVDEGLGPEVVFRSGIQQGSSSNLHLEVLFGPAVKVGPAELGAWLASLVPIDLSLQAPLVDGLLRVTAISPAFEPGVLGVAVRGTLSGTAFGVSLTGNEVSGVLRCSPSPDTAADARSMVSVGTAPGGSSIRLTGSFLAMFADSLLSVALPMMEGTIIDLVRSWIDSAAKEAVCSSLFLSEPPAGATFTMRSCLVDANGLTVIPVVGAVDQTLSTYDPPPILPL